MNTFEKKIEYYSPFINMSPKRKKKLTALAVIGMPCESTSSGSIMPS